MTRYTVDQRKWLPTPYGFDVWVIPGREVAAVVELPEMPTRTNPPGAAVRYLVDYLTQHGSATCSQMEPDDGRFTPGTLSGCLAAHPELFTARTWGELRKGPKVWQLRRHP